MNLDYPFVCDIETVGLLPDLTEGQEEDFGVPKPESNGLEIHVISPNGTEIIRHREALMGFSVSEYKEEVPSKKINLV